MPVDRFARPAVSCAALLAVLLAAGCNGADQAGDKPRTETATTPAAVPTADATARPQDGRFVLPGVRDVVRAPSATELLARYPEAQRAELQRFYASYGHAEGVSRYSFSNVMEFKNEAQLDWLIRNGFPMPDEVLAAAAMSDSQLLDLAKAGNLKAGAFLLRRRSEVRQRSGGDTASMSELVELDGIRNALVASGSPFAGYVVADIGIRNGNLEEAVAGYAYAAHLGDTRALDFMRTLDRPGRSISASGSILAYTALQSIALRNPQLADKKAVVRRPQFPRF